MREDFNDLVTSDGIEYHFGKRINRRDCEYGYDESTISFKIRQLSNNNGNGTYAVTFEGSVEDYQTIGSIHLYSIFFTFNWAEIWSPTIQIDTVDGHTIEVRTPVCVSKKWNAIEDIEEYFLDSIAKIVAFIKLQDPIPNTKVADLLYSLPSSDDYQQRFVDFHHLKTFLTPLQRELFIQRYGEFMVSAFGDK